jgi:hypothetical protein
MALAATVVVAVMSCGGSPLDSAPTCTESLEALYNVEDCAMYNISVKPPAKMGLSEAMLWCRQVVTETQQKCSQCEDQLAAWLRCTPTACIWNQSAQMNLANDCNDELDRLVTCCN